MEVVMIVAGFFAITALAWNLRIFFYTLSDEYEIDQRLKAISK